MKRLFRLFSILILLSLLGNACSPIINVYSEEEPGINLRKYRSYDWLDNKVVESDNVMYFLAGKTEAQIEGSIEQQMSRFGYKKCNQNPDLLLHYHVIVKNFEMYYQDWWCEDETWNKYGRCQRMRATSYKEGTLIVDMIDAQTGNQVWRGVAIGVLDQIPPEDVQVNIDRAVKAIFKKFPETALPGA